MENRKYTRFSLLTQHISQKHDRATLGDKTLNPFPNKPWFLHVCSTSL